MEGAAATGGSSWNHAVAPWVVYALVGARSLSPQKGIAQLFSVAPGPPWCTLMQSTAAWDHGCAEAVKGPSLPNICRRGKRQGTGIQIGSSQEAEAEALVEALVCVCCMCVRVLGCQGLGSISSKNRKAWENIEGSTSYACKE